MKLPPAEFVKRQMHARPLFCFSMAFLTGVIIGHSRHIALPVSLTCSAVLLLAYFLLLKRRKNWPLIIMAAALCLGMVRIESVPCPVTARENRYSVTMNGRVISEPYIKSETGRLIFEFEINTVDGIIENDTVRMYLRGDPDLLNNIRYGQELNIPGHIWAPDAATNPNEFDFGAYLAESGLSAYATAKIEEVSILSERRTGKSILLNLRSHIADQIERVFPENGPLILALVLADRSHLSDDIRDSFQETGITHLICISGMHVSVLAVAMLFFLKRLFSRKHAIGITLFFLIIYGVLIGFTSSYVRALIMFIIFSCAPIAGYPSDGITRLSAAMLVTLLIAPEQISDAGFVLSYTATAGIILLYPPLLNLFGLDEAVHKKPFSNRFLQFAQKTLFYFPKLLCATLSAQLATLPAVIAFFGIQSIISIPVNLLCVPLCMLAYPFAMIALLASFISLPLGTVLGTIPETLLSALSQIALHSASLPITGIRIGKYTALLILLHGCIIFSASELSVIRKSVRRFIPLTLVIVASLASLNTHLHTLGHCITFLDADQADCAVIQTEGYTYLIDAGNTYTPAGDYLDARCLKLDAVFLSHPDQDHAGGLIDVLDTMSPEKLYIPAGWDIIEDISQSVIDGIDMAKNQGTEIIELSAGDSIVLSENTIARVYAPAADLKTEDSNAVSMVLSITHKNHSVLFTGDLPIRYEPSELPSADILKVAHHGSDESTSASFLNKVKPDIAVISVGENNFGHPSEAVLERLSNAGVSVLRTDLSGAITLRLDKNGNWHADTYLPTGGIK